MEPGAIETYIEDALALLRPTLLVHARSWERLGLAGPPPAELAQQMTELWLAMLEASAD